MTPEEFADIVNNNGDHVFLDTTKQFLLGASAREIQRFIHHLHIENKTRHFKVARVALNVRISEDADIMTRRIVCLTWSLLVFTIGLFVLTAALLVITYYPPTH